MRQSLNWITAELQARSRDGSILTSYAEDDKRVWKEFRRGLVRERFSSKVIEKHGKTIREYIMELGTRGALDNVLPDGDEAIPVSWNTTLSVEEDSSGNGSNEENGEEGNGTTEEDEDSEELGEDASEEEEEAEDEEAEEVVLKREASVDEESEVVETLDEEEIRTDESSADPTSDRSEYGTETEEARRIAIDFGDIGDIINY